MQTEIILTRSHAGSIDDVRDRLGSTGHFNRVFGDVLDEGARVGEQSAEMYAPERTRRLKREIKSVPAREQVSGALEAKVGVGEVNSLPGGRAGPLRENQSLYPLYVHEGTGLYGALHRLIRPRRAKAMVWPGPGRTGLIHAKTTRGQRPQPYMAEAFEDVDAFIRGRIDLAVRQLFD